jgi:excisionase family DNA binding protein
MNIVSSTRSLKLLLTPEEAANALGVSRTFLYGLLARQQIFSVKVGGARRIPLRSLENYVEDLCEQQKAS